MIKIMIIMNYESKIKYHMNYESKSQISIFSDKCLPDLNSIHENVLCSSYLTTTGSHKVEPTHPKGITFTLFTRVRM